MDAATSVQFILAALGCMLAAFATRQVIWQRLRALPASSQPAPAAVPAPPAPLSAGAGLRPAEMAYLLRDGDITHTMLVMVADLIQRIVKSRPEAPVELQPYETAIFESVKEFVGRWANQKLGEIVPVDDLRNPLKWLMRIKAIKTFFGESLRRFLQDFIKDPLHIRKYFSWTGIMRLTVNLCTTSARQAIELSLHEELQAKGLLVPEARRRSCANRQLLLIPAMVAAALGLRHLFALPSSLLSFAVFLIIALANACAIRAILALPSLIPSYDEFSRIVADIPRSGTRMGVLRLLLRLSRLLVVLIMLLACALVLLLDLGINFLFFHLTTLTVLTVAAGGAILCLPIVQSILDWHSLTTHDHASAVAIKELAASQKQLAAVSPLTSLKDMLTEEKYDPQFSQVLATYGIETLWLLG